MEFINHHSNFQQNINEKTYGEIDLLEKRKAKIMQKEVIQLNVSHIIINKLLHNQH